MVCFCVFGAVANVLTLFFFLSFVFVGVFCLFFLYWGLEGLGRGGALTLRFFFWGGGGVCVFIVFVSWLFVFFWLF